MTRRELLAGAAMTGASCFGGVAFAASPASSDVALSSMLGALADAMLTDNPEGATFLGLDKGARAPEGTAVVGREDAPGDPGHRCRRIVCLRGLCRRVAGRRLQGAGTRRLGRERTSERKAKQ